MSFFDEIKSDFKARKVYQEVTITPHIAKEMLQYNTKNRAIKRANLQNLVEQMKRGEFKYSGDSIRFSRTGELLDGQHRLEAIIESDTRQKMMVVTGLDPEVFTVIDTGSNRRATDIMSIKGHKNAGVIAGAMRLVLLYERKALGSSHGNYSKNKMVTNTDIAEWENTHSMPLMEECVDLGSRCYLKARFFSPSTYAGLAYLFARKNRQMAFDFMEKLSGGEGISHDVDSPIYVLRQRLINMKEKKVGSAEKYALVLKAWNYYREGAKVKRLLWGDQEVFPKVQ